MQCVSAAYLYVACRWKAHIHPHLDTSQHITHLRLARRGTWTMPHTTPAAYRYAACRWKVHTHPSHTSHHRFIPYHITSHQIAHNRRLACLWMCTTTHTLDSPEEAQDQSHTTPAAHHCAACRWEAHTHTHTHTYIYIYSHHITSHTP